MTALPPPGPAPRPGPRLAAALALLLAAPAAAAPRKSPLSGLVVRSREYVVRRSTAGVTEEFSGDVRYSQRDKEVRADWALLDRERGRFQARGGVRAVMRWPSGASVRASGHAARHDEGLRRGAMSGRDAASPVLLEHEAPGPTGGPAVVRDRAVARTLEWDEAASRLTMTGAVHAWGPDGECFAGAASYDRPGRTVELSGRRPVVSRAEARWEGALQADRIRATHAPDDCRMSGREACATRLEARGAVRGWIRFKDGPAGGPAAPGGRRAGAGP